ncbi:MAG TPA: hypothetical protein VJB05_03965 [archaeon]|nr:hypothetical protein [archaeon]
MPELKCGNCKRELSETFIYTEAGTEIYCSVGCGYQVYQGAYRYTPMPNFVKITREQAMEFIKNLTTK